MLLLINILEKYERQKYESHWLFVKYLNILKNKGYVTVKNILKRIFKRLNIKKFKNSIEK